MSRLIKLTSAKSGATATARRVLSAAGTTSPPTLATEGVLLEGPHYAWVTFKLTGTSATIDLYSYDPVSQVWAKLLPSTEFSFTITATCRYRILLEGGPVRIQPVVSAEDFTQLDVWIASAVEQP